MRPKRAKMRLICIETVWNTLGEPKTNFRFELLLKNRIKCYSCLKRFNNLEQGLLKDQIGILDNKRKCLAKGKGEFNIKDPMLMCVECWNSGKMLIKKDKHHRIIVRYLNIKE
jgi:hypothetical protein